MTVFSVSNDSGSRKKLVTLMSMSLYRRRSSAALLCTNLT